MSATSNQRLRVFGLRRGSFCASTGAYKQVCEDARAKTDKVSSQKIQPLILWITDPWDTLDHSRDTTLRLAQAGLEAGVPQFWCDVKTIRLSDHVTLGCQELLPGNHLGVLQTAVPADFTQIHYRTDPPVDLAYLHPLQLLRMAPATEFVNPIDLLLTRNEKILGQSLKGLSPRTLVSSRWEDLERFGRAEKKTVLKPLFEAQSKGIELLEWTHPRQIRRARDFWAKASDGGARPILLQEFLPGIKRGETRLWFVDGKLLATIKKLPLSGDFRVNLDAGSRLRPCQLTASEKRASTQIGKFLLKLGIRLAAVDLIDGKITDFNFTSPGLIPLMETVLGRPLAPTVIHALLRRVHQPQG